MDESRLFYLPSSSLKCVTCSFSSSVKTVSCILQNTGHGKYHSSLDVKPLALFCLSSIIGIAVCGCVKPSSVNVV